MTTGENLQEGSLGKLDCEYLTRLPLPETGELGFHTLFCQRLVKGWGYVQAQKSQSLRRTHQRRVAGVSC